MARRRCSRTGAVFHGVPDVVAELLDLSITGTTQWGEWYWHGRHADGTAFGQARGDHVSTGSIMYRRASDITSWRTVKTAEEGIDAAVRELHTPPAPSSP